MVRCLLVHVSLLCDPLDNWRDNEKILPTNAFFIDQMFLTSPLLKERVVLTAGLHYTSRQENQQKPSSLMAWHADCWVQFFGETCVKFTTIYFWYHSRRENSKSSPIFFVPLSCRFNVSKTNPIPDFSLPGIISGQVFLNCRLSLSLGSILLVVTDSIWRLLASFRSLLNRA